MSTQVIELRRLLEQRWPDAQPLRHATAAGVSTGVPALDAILPGGGLPRGRLSVWATEAAVGATAVLRSACEVVRAAGERAVWVDGARVVAGDRWWQDGGALLVRPAGALDALVCAEELVRSGGFGLVVLTGVGRALVPEAVRLSRAAREGGSALVAVGEAPLAALRLASRVLADGVRWTSGPLGEPAEPAAVRLRVQATSLGLDSRAEFMIPVVQHALRMSMEPGLVDRRGAGI